MIKDIGNCREVHLGHGTVAMDLDTTRTVEVLYHKPFTLNRNFIGIEKDINYYEVAKQRLSEAKGEENAG